MASGVSLRGAALTVNQGVVFPFSVWQLCLFLPGLCLLFILVLSGKIKKKAEFRSKSFSFLSHPCVTLRLPRVLRFYFIKISDRNYKCFSNTSSADHQINWSRAESVVLLTINQEVPRRAELKQPLTAIIFYILRSVRRSLPGLDED